MNPETQPEPQEASQEADWYIGPAPVYGLALCLRNPVLYIAAVAMVGSFLAQLHDLISPRILAVTLGGGLVLCGLAVILCLWKASSVSYLISPARKAIFMESGLPGLQARIRHTILFNQIYDCDLVASPIEQAMGVSSLTLKLTHREVLRLEFIRDAGNVCDWINRNGAGDRAKPFEAM